MPREKVNQKEKEIFSKNLKYLIQRDNIKHIVLAKKLNKSRSIINYYLSGGFPGLNALDELAEIFHVSPDDLRKKDLTKPSKKLNESEKASDYQMHLFLPQLSGRHSLFHEDNFEGILRATFPFCKAQVKDRKANAYAVNIGADSILSCGIPKKSLVIFDRNEPVKTNDVAAVYFKGDNKISIRLVTIQKHEYIFSYDKGDVVVPKKEAKTTFRILGKVVKVQFDL